MNRWACAGEGDGCGKSLRHELRGKVVGAIITGGNVDLRAFVKALEERDIEAPG